MIQVRPVNFCPPNFVKHFQTSQAPSSCFGVGQIFVSFENRTDFTICTAWSKEKVFKYAHDYQIENLAETNFVEIFGRAKQILSVQCVRTLVEHTPGLWYNYFTSLFSKGLWIWNSQLLLDVPSSSRNQRDMLLQSLSSENFLLFVWIQRCLGRFDGNYVQ